MLVKIIKATAIQKMLEELRCSNQVVFMIPNHILKYISILINGKVLIFNLKLLFVF